LGVIGFILAFGYTYRAELRNMPTGDGELVPGRAVQRSERMSRSYAAAAAISSGGAGQRNAHRDALDTGASGWC